MWANERVILMKKKFAVGIVTGCLALTLATGALAEQKEQVEVYEQNKLAKSVIFIVGQDKYYVDGDTKGVQMDATPYISPQGRTFVPVRFLGNALGVDNENISWDGEEGKATLTLGEATAELIVGKQQIVTNGQAKEMDVAPELKNSRTFLPARFVAEALGYQVDFLNGMVVAWPQGVEKPAEDILAVQQQVQQPEPGQQSTVDVGQIGKPVAGQPWAEWVDNLDGPSKYITVSDSDLKTSDIQLTSNTTVKDIVIDKDNIEVTLKTTTPIFSILLIDDENRIRLRDAGSKDPADNRKFTFKVPYTNYDGDYPPTDITKIKTIIIGTVGNALEVTNPYYGGGK
ncbi:copper amine oxidase N-terminal domain-containing protein [Desulforamulus ruminis]|uniref:copper amine oxidase N-terminal domain-containing protein n=1 Tax=Desulforamulus ruminis TaxID=1564 RepID=UPI002FDB121B